MQIRIVSFAGESPSVLKTVEVFMTKCPRCAIGDDVYTGGNAFFHVTSGAACTCLTKNLSELLAEKV